MQGGAESMRLGWIDYSKEDRKKVLSVIDLLFEEGALDELGLGPVRDGFANLFFPPGTSTIQTRAKYFLIVPPYALYGLTLKGETNPANFLRLLDGLEHECGRILYDSQAEGTIGSRAIAGGRWVKRPPSQIYWAGIRRYRIFTGANISLPEYAKAISLLNQDKQNLKRQRSLAVQEDYEEDDPRAGRLANLSFWNLPPPMTMIGRKA